MTSDEVMANIESDGVPRYALCGPEKLSPLLEPAEVARVGATLYIKPDPLCFLYYMNSSSGSSQGPNVSRRSVWDEKSPPKEDAKALLVDSKEGVELKIFRPVKKGEELLCDYLIFPPATGGIANSTAPPASSPRRSVRSRGAPAPDR